MKILIIYIKILLIFVIFAFANPFDMPVSPFLMAAFCALAYCKYNVLLLTPLYLIAVLTAKPTGEALIVATALPIIIYLLYLIFGKCKKSVPVPLVLICEGLCSATFLFLADRSVLDWFFNLIAIILAGYAAIPTFFALTVQRSGAATLRKDAFCTSVMLLGIALSAATLNIAGISVLYLAASVAILLAVECLDKYHAILVAIVFAAASAVKDGALYDFLLLPVSTLCCLIFAKTKRYLYMPVYAISFIVLSLYENHQISYVVPFCEVAAATLFCTLLPTKLLTRVSVSAACIEDADTLCRYRLAYVERRLRKMSDGFRELSAKMRFDCPTQIGDEQVKELCDAVARNECINCVNYYRCFAGNATPYTVFGDVIRQSINSGKADYSSLPREIILCCDKTNRLLEMVNVCVTQYLGTITITDSVYASGAILSEQLKENSLVLTQIADSIQQDALQREKTERKICDELCYNNILCYGAGIYVEENGALHCAVTVRRGDESKTLLKNILEKTLSQRLIYTCPPTVQGDRTICDFVTIPRLDAVYGYAKSNKNGSIYSGDRKSIMRIGTDKILVMLSDGMGSGESAQRYSDKTVALVENLFELGYSATAVTSLGNKYLSLDDSGFSACDIGIIDLRKGLIDLIKAGSAPSYIYKNNILERIENRRVPLGIIRNLSPHNERISINDKSALILLSDGITDRLGDEDISAIIRDRGIQNPMTTAQTLLDTAQQKSGGAFSPEDDMSVLVVRIFAT